MWMEEALPADTMLYVPLLAMPSRARQPSLPTGSQVLTRLGESLPKLFQVGGNETVGQGWVRPVLLNS
jgi:CRISPR/Cas system CMR subunit Cmr4 (Cas7 group RAMP superfamily)